MNHAPTAHAIPFLNTKINTLVNVNESPCASVVTMFAMAHALLIYLWLSGGFPPPAAGHPCVVFSGIDY